MAAASGRAGRRHACRARQGRDISPVQDSAPAVAAARRAPRQRSPRSQSTASHVFAPPSAISSSSTLPDVEQLHVEDQRGVRRYRAGGTLGAIAVFRRDRQRSASAYLHASNPIVPSADDPPLAEGEREWFAATVRAVELLPLVIGLALVIEPAGVMHGYGSPGGGLVASADRLVGLDQFRDVGLPHVLLGRAARCNGKCGDDYRDPA